MKTRISVLSLTAVLALTACSTGPAPTTCTAPAVLQNGVCVTPVTTGSVTFVGGNAATTTVTTSTGAAVAASTYGTLAPGTYNVVFARPGFTSVPSTFNVTAGGTTIVNAPTLVAIPATGPGYYYRNSAGTLVQIPAADLTNPDKFVFTAWLEDLNDADGDPVGVVVADSAITGTSTADERDEVAPSRTQNLAGAYIGYIAADGNTYPVSGGTVRWNITGVPDITALVDALDLQGREELTPEQNAFLAAIGILGGPVGSNNFFNTYFGTNDPMIFGAADDGGNDTGFTGGITPLAISAAGKQADTITNYSGARNTPFPSLNANYPLYNQTSVGTPNVDGFTWTTLFANRAYAAGEVIAVGFIGDMEIDKVILNKFFAPQPDLSIVKDVIDEGVSTVEGPIVVDTNGVIPDGNLDGVVDVTNGTVTMRVTVRNAVGAGPAQVNVSDILTIGNLDAYAISNVVTAGTGTVTVAPTANTNGGFDGVIDLDGGEFVTFTFTIDASEPGTYCDEARITEFFSPFFGVTEPTNLYDEACALFIAPQFNITKLSAGQANVTASPGQIVPVTLTVTNNGNATGTFDLVQEYLTRTGATPATLTARPIGFDDPNYTVTTPPVTNQTATANGDGFLFDFNRVDDPATPLVNEAASVITLAPGETYTYTINVSATADGRYCDIAQINDTSFGPEGADNQSNEFCLTVVTPTITKTNAPLALEPGDSYTSTITVRNPSPFVPIDISLTDTLGSNGLSTTTSTAIYGSSTVQVRNSAGTPVGTSTAGIPGTVGTVAGVSATTSPATIQIPAGGSVVFTVNSTIPLGGGGTYCNVATFVPTFNPAFTPNTARSCVDVNNTIALQTIYIDDDRDPIVRNAPVVGSGGTTYTSVLYNEIRSNEEINTSTVYYALGATTGVLDGDLPLPVNPGDGLFKQPTNTLVYFDPTPVLNPAGGVTSTPATSTTDVLLTAGTDYTITTNANGEQTIVITRNLQPGQAFYVVQENVGAAVPAGSYNSNFVWVATGVNGTLETAEDSEPTNVKNP